MENLRVKEVAKRKGISMLDLAENLGISYVALNRRLHTGKIETIVKIAEILKCEVSELFTTGNEYAHFYDSAGEWQGIRRK